PAPAAAPTVQMAHALPGTRAHRAAVSARGREGRSYRSVHWSRGSPPDRGEHDLDARPAPVHFLGIDFWAGAGQLWHGRWIRNQGDDAGTHRLKTERIARGGKRNGFVVEHAPVGASGFRDRAAWGCPCGR